MYTLPSELAYTANHEWLRVEEDGCVTVGITDYAQQLLGDIVLVELPAVNAVLLAGESAGVVESVKVASDIYAPVSGTVLAVNQTLLTEPEKVNADPYQAGWLLRLQPSHLDEWQGLLSAAAYADCMDE